MRHRATPLVLAALTSGALSLAAPAGAATLTSCGEAKGKVGTNTYVFAVHIQAKGLGCKDAKAFWTSYATGVAGPAGTETLRARCKTGSKADNKAANKKGRSAYSCVSANGKRVLKAWVLNG